MVRVAAYMANPGGLECVDLPSFVSGLIQGVFQAIVDASTKQLHAYGELLKSVAQTLDKFVQDTLGTNSARGWLIDTYPGELGLDEEAAAGKGAQPHLVIRGDDHGAALRRLNADLPLGEPVTDLSDPEQQARLVAAARPREQKTGSGPIAPRRTQRSAARSRPAASGARLPAVIESEQVGNQTIATKKRMDTASALTLTQD